MREATYRRGEALSEREAAGSGSLGAASSESAAGSVCSAPGLRLLSRPRIRSSRGRVWVCWRVWMVVRFVCVFRVLVSARVSRVCPGMSRLPPVSFTGGVTVLRGVWEFLCSQK